MPADAGPILIAGHICADIIPALPSAQGRSLGDILKPGTLVNVGPVTTSTGGAVANTGLALFKLGASVALAGKVGTDAFGDLILKVLRGQAPALADAMIVTPGADSSYTMVISVPGIDRVFLHHPGANDTFTAGDLPEATLRTAGLLHFGYPPLMRQMFLNDGDELVKLLERAREAHVPTSLDMSMPDPNSESGQVNWTNLLRRVLPLVDIFQPSVEELSFMLREPAEADDLDAVQVLAEQCLALGAGAVAIKLGGCGLYLQTGGVERVEALQTLLGRQTKDWANRRLYTPCFQANMVGTTGSGDCTIAGMLDAVNRGLAPEEALRFAVAVGACSVEAPDATGGIVRRAKVEERLRGDWRQLNPVASAQNWRPTEVRGVFSAPNR